MFRISVCDDDLAFLAIIQAFLEESPEYQVQSFDSAQSLIAGKGTNADIAILDIQLSETTGIDLAAQIHAVNPACQIIFLSDYLDFAPQVYDVPHVYFVLKSQFRERLPQALQQAKALLEQDRDAFVSIPNGRNAQILRKSSIRYLERNLHQTTVFCDSETFQTREPLTSLAQLLGDDFCRVHVSYLVNLSRIRSIRNTELTLLSGEVIPVSRSHSQQAQQAYAAFWGRG